MRAILVVFAVLIGCNQEVESEQDEKPTILEVLNQPIDQPRELTKREAITMALTLPGVISPQEMATFLHVENVDRLLNQKMNNNCIDEQHKKINSSDDGSIDQSGTIDLAKCPSIVVPGLDLKFASGNATYRVSETCHKGEPDYRYSYQHRHDELRNFVVPTDCRHHSFHFMESWEGTIRGRDNDGNPSYTPFWRKISINGLDGKECVQKQKGNYIKLDNCQFAYHSYVDLFDRRNPYSYAYAQYDNVEYSTKAHPAADSGAILFEVGNWEGEIHFDVGVRTLFLENDEESIEGKFKIQGIPTSKYINFEADDGNIWRVHTKAAPSTLPAELYATDDK